jgi:RNA recognition motif-containing protein
MNTYVGNLSLETIEDELSKEFTEFGDVISVTIMNDNYIGSGQPRGYGYVEIASKSEGTSTIANLEETKLRNRVVSVVESLALSNRGITGSLNIRSNSRLHNKRERR